MRGSITLLAAIVVVVSCFSPSFKPGIECGPNGECPPGTMCDVDRICRGQPGVADAGMPDATPVACTTNADCMVPPNPCLQPGTCNANNVCDFVEVDCTAMTDDCNDGVCEMATGACIRVPAREASSCGAGQSCGAFGPCGGFADTCDGTGTQARDCVRNICQTGTCAAQPYVENADCTRNTEGVACGADTVTGCGGCGGFSDTCDESGTMSCTCTSFRCASQTCTANPTGCQQGCSRSTTGVTCGSPTVTDCGTCTFGSVCAETAPDVSCTCTSFACGGGACQPSASSCAQACPPRDTDGELCGCTVQGCLGGPEPEPRPRCCGSGVCSVNCGACGEC